MRYSSIRFLALATLAIQSTFAAQPNANEYTITEKAFYVETVLDAVFLPAKSSPIFIQPEVWTDFKVTSVIAQGTLVKKGDTLIEIDTEKLDLHITEAKKSNQVAALRLAQTKHALTQLEVSTPRTLAAHDRAEKEAEENFNWYSKIGHPQEIEETNHSVASAEFRVEYQREELKQLKKMYGEDNITEETEEIILKRTQKSVEHAEFALKSAKSDAQRALKTTLPRKLATFKRKLETAKIENTSAQQALPRELKLKQLDLIKAERDHQENIANIDKLKADRAMMNITAPADGVIYYGSMHAGQWSPSDAASILKKGNNLPSATPLMTFIPNGTPLQLHAFAPESSIAQISSTTTGHAVTPLNRYRHIPISITQLSSYPDTSGSYHLALKPELPNNHKIVPGMKATITLINQKIDNALTIPASYLSDKSNGSYTVKLKLADGKTQNRKVTIGSSNQDSVVITSGLEQGQVIVK